MRGCFFLFISNMAIEKGLEGEDKTPVGPSQRELDLEKKLSQAFEAIEKLQLAQSNQPQQGILTEEALARILKAATANNSKGPDLDPGVSSYVEEADIDPDDLIEDGHTFYCHQGGYIIVDDKRSNRSVRTPHNTIIKFELLYTTRRYNGRDIDLDIVSSYTSYSKKEVEWLKNSTFYGVHIFDDIQKASSKGAKRAQKIGKFLSAAKSMERKELMKACKVYDIPITHKIEDMRLALASVYAEKELIQDEQVNQMRAKNALIEESIIKQLK